MIGKAGRHKRNFGIIVTGRPVRPIAVCLMNYQ